MLHQDSNELLRSIGRAFLEAQEQNEEAKDLIKILIEQVSVLTLIAQKETDSPHLQQLISTDKLLSYYKSFLENRSAFREQFIKNLSYIAQQTQQ